MFQLQLQQSVFIVIVLCCLLQPYTVNLLLQNTVFSHNDVHVSAQLLRPLLIILVLPLHLPVLFVRYLLSYGVAVVFLYLLVEPVVVSSCASGWFLIARLTHRSVLECQVDVVFCQLHAIQFLESLRLENQFVAVVELFFDWVARQVQLHQRVVSGYLLTQLLKVGYFVE